MLKETSRDFFQKINLSTDQRVSHTVCHKPESSMQAGARGDAGASLLRDLVMAFPRLGGQRLFQKIGPNEVLLPL